MGPSSRPRHRTKAVAPNITPSSPRPAPPKAEPRDARELLDNFKKNRVASEAIRKQQDEATMEDRESKLADLLDNRRKADEEQKEANRRRRQQIKQDNVAAKTVTEEAIRQEHMKLREERTRQREEYHDLTVQIERERKAKADANKCEVTRRQEERKLARSSSAERLRHSSSEPGRSSQPRTRERRLKQGFSAYTGKPGSAGTESLRERWSKVKAPPVRVVVPPRASGRARVARDSQSPNLGRSSEQQEDEDEEEGEEEEECSAGSRQEWMQRYQKAVGRVVLEAQERISAPGREESPLPPKSRLAWRMRCDLRKEPFPAHGLPPLTGKSGHLPRLREPSFPPMVLARMSR